MSRNMETGQVVGIWLQPSIIKRIDRLAHRDKRTRSNWLALLIEAELTRAEARLKPAPKE